MSETHRTDSPDAKTLNENWVDRYVGRGLLGGPSEMVLGWPDHKGPNLNAAIADETRRSTTKGLDAPLHKEVAQTLDFVRQEMATSDGLRLLETHANQEGVVSDDLPAPALDDYSTPTEAYQAMEVNLVQAQDHLNAALQNLSGARDVARHMNWMWGEDEHVLAHTIRAALVEHAATTEMLRQVREEGRG